MRDIFQGDNFTGSYKELTNKIRDTLESISQEQIANGSSRKGVGMAVIDVVHAMVPSLNR